MGRFQRSLALVAASLLLPAAVQAQAPAAGYLTQLVLDGPTSPGPDQTITGSGAPFGPGVFVELWKTSPGSGVAESVQSVEVMLDGRFRFEHVDVLAGEHYHVTMSRSWHFNNDGDTEGWNGNTSLDTVFEVSGGTLKISMRDGNRDGIRDPYMTRFFSYVPSAHRVIEIRYRHMSAFEPNIFAVFWGAPWDQKISYHLADTPSNMTDFQTMLIPMNVGENQATPTSGSDMDGLWTDQPMNDSLRIDPLNGLPRNDDTFDGLVFEIDYIRIREDYRMDFNMPGDFSGLTTLQGFDSISVSDGFMSYTASTAQPQATCDFFTGALESGHFTRFFMGCHNNVTMTDMGHMAFRFNDRDSGDTYMDDGGTLQLAQGDVELSGRRDVTEMVDNMTSPAGEWTEDGAVSVRGMSFDLPQLLSATDEMRVDYMGFTSSDPYGPSNVMPNNSPVAVIMSDPSPAAVVLDANGMAGLVLDGSGSSDGDGEVQHLTFLWSKVSGPAGDGMDFNDQEVINVSFTAPGSYVYRLDVDDGNRYFNSAFAEIAITVEEAPPQNIFLRGDVDANGVALELTDARELMNHLYGETPIVCADAADVDDDGMLTGTDVNLIVRYHFFCDERPVDLFSGCAVDDTEDDLPECAYPVDACQNASYDESGCGGSSGEKELKKLKKQLKKLKELLMDGDLSKAERKALKEELKELKEELKKMKKELKKKGS